MTHIDIPDNQHTVPWVQSLLQFIQEQSRIIQKQTEQITALKTTVQELRDEITRLKNTPKRPKFRPGKTFQQNKNKSASTPGSHQASRNTTSRKSKEEVIVRATEIPEGSRFKGYTDYSTHLTQRANEID